MIIGTCPVLKKSLSEHKWKYAEETAKKDDIIVEICSTGWVHYIEGVTKKRITLKIEPSEGYNLFKSHIYSHLRN